MSEIILTGKNQVEQANYEVSAELVTQEQLVEKPVIGKIWQVLPGKDPGTFIILRRNLVAWTHVVSPGSCHNASETSNKVVGMSPIILGAIIGSTIGSHS